MAGASVPPHGAGWRSFAAGVALGVLVALAAAFARGGGGGGCGGWSALARDSRGCDARGAGVTSPADATRARWRSGSGSSDDGGDDDTITWVFTVGIEGSGHHMVEALFREFVDGGVLDSTMSLLSKVNYIMSHPYHDMYQGGVWTVTENVTTPFGTLPVRNQLVRPSTRVPQDYEDIQAFAPGPRGFRRLLEYAIREVDHEARESGNKVVYMVSCSYPCGFLDIGGTSADFQRTNDWIRSPSVREEHLHAFGNSPDTLELIDAIERPHTVEGTYKPGKVKVISLWRDPLQCVASTTGRSGSRQAFQGFLKQVTALQTELVVANAHVAALDPASWVRLNYTAYYSDIEGTARLLLRWLHLDEAMAVPAGQKLTGARLGGRNLQGQKGVGDEEAADVHKRSSGALSHALGQRAKNKRAASGRGAGVAQHARGATPEDVVPEDQMAEDAMAEEVMPEDTRRQGGPRRDAFSATMRSKFTTRELDLVNALFYRKNQKALWADLLREDRALERVVAAN